MTGLPASRALGGYVAFRRDLVGLDQESFAQLTGWSRATVSRLERGLRGLEDEGEVFKVAKALRVSPDALRQGAESEGATGAQPSNAEILAEVRELRALVERMAADAAAARVVTEVLPMAKAVRAAVAADRAAIDAREAQPTDRPASPE